MWSVKPGAGLPYWWACFWCRQTVNRPASTGGAQIVSQECHQANSMIELSARRASAMPGNVTARSVQTSWMLQHHEFLAAMCPIGMQNSRFPASFLGLFSGQLSSCQQQPGHRICGRAVGAVLEPQHFRFWGRAFGSKCLFVCRAALSSHPDASFRPILVIGFPARLAGPKN